MISHTHTSGRPCVCVHTRAHVKHSTEMLYSIEQTETARQAYVQIHSRSTISLSAVPPTPPTPSSPRTQIVQHVCICARTLMHVHACPRMLSDRNSDTHTHSSTFSSRYARYTHLATQLSIPLHTTCTRLASVAHIVRDW